MQIFRKIRNKYISRQKKARLSIGNIEFLHNSLKPISLILLSRIKSSDMINKSVPNYQVNYFSHSHLQYLIFLIVKKMKRNIIYHLNSFSFLIFKPRSQLSKFSSFLLFKFSKLAFFNQLSIFQNQYSITFLHGTQPMSNNNRGSISHHIFKSFLHQLFTFSI